MNEKSERFSSPPAQAQSTGRQGPVPGRAECRTAGDLKTRCGVLKNTTPRTSARALHQGHHSRPSETEHPMAAAGAPGGAGPPGRIALHDAPVLTVAGPLYSDAEAKVLFAYFLKRKGYTKTLQAFTTEVPEIAAAAEKHSGGPPTSAEQMHTHFCLVRLHEQMPEQLAMKSPAAHRQAPAFRRADGAPALQADALRLSSPGAVRKRLENGAGGENGAAAAPGRAAAAALGAPAAAATAAVSGADASRSRGAEAAPAAAPASNEATGALSTRSTPPLGDTPPFEGALSHALIPDATRRCPLWWAFLSKCVALLLRRDHEALPPSRLRSPRGQP